jgi:hypothetical protein
MFGQIRGYRQVVLLLLCSALSGSEANFVYTHHFSTLLIKIAWHDSKQIPIFFSYFPDSL